MNKALSKSTAELGVALNPKSTIRFLLSVHNQNQHRWYIVYMLNTGQYTAETLTYKEMHVNEIIKQLWLSI